MDIRSLPARRAAALAAGTLLVLTSAACGSDSDGNDDSASPTVTPTETGGATSATPTGTPTESGSSTDCTYTEDGSTDKAELPPAQALAKGDVKATMDTSVGDFNLTLDAAAAPCTVNSFVSLAEQGFFNDTSCHRLVTEGIFVLQCGDPTGTGTGGPGYRFADELSGEETYPAGTLAMANAGPDTNGSQFFIVYADTELPPSYTVFGTVDGDTVKRVAKVAEAGNAADGVAPATKVEIEKVSVD